MDHGQEGGGAAAGRGGQQELPLGQDLHQYTEVNIQYHSLSVWSSDICETCLTEDDVIIRRVEGGERGGGAGQQVGHHVEAEQEQAAVTH